MPATKAVDLAAHPLTAWQGPLGLPDFAIIGDDQFGPVFDAALKAHAAEIDAIAGNGEAPTVENTLAALELAGDALDHVSSIFWCRAGAHTNDTIQALERDMSPKMSRHFSAISMNEKLFARIDDLYQRRDSAEARPRDAARAGKDLEGLCPLGREARRGRARSGLRPSTRSFPRSAPTSARTSWPTNATGRCSSTRPISPACPIS
ncbi:MAG: hypothetical protein QM754_20805 [Tepidisphaeraceae bacterium]